MALALAAESVGREHVRVVVRASSEREALRYAVGRPLGLDLALTLVAIRGVDDTIAASFAINLYTINASAGSGGTIDPVGPVAATCGSDRSFNITPGSGFAIANVLVDGSPVGAVTSHTFTNVVANHTIAASFVDVAAPSVAVIAPNGGEYWHGPRLIRWTASDNVVVDSVDVAYSVHGPGGPWVNILQSGSPPDSVEWTPPDECGDSAMVRITCYDPTGNTGSDVSDGLFHLRCTPLAIGEGSAPSLALHVPNPVHGGRVHMRVSLPAAARATLDILAVTGQRVWSTQLDGSPGVHNLIWDGRAGDSGVVEPGVYFARLVTPLGGRSVRFVLLR
jgi:hypothetical protein